MHSQANTVADLDLFMAVQTKHKRCPIGRHKEKEGLLACSVHVVIEDKAAASGRVQDFALQLSLVARSVAAALDEHVVT